MSDESEIKLSDSQRMLNNLNGIGRQTDDSLFFGGVGIGSTENVETNKFPIDDERYQYGVTISYTDSYIENGEIKTKNFYQPLDLITSVSEKLSSQITSYPMTDRDYVMDHSFSEPITVTISGQFGLYGRNARLEKNNKSTNNIYPPAISFDNNNSRLKRIQETFERLKEDGYILSLTTIDGSGSNGSNAKLAFKRRPSMVLTDISWDTENPSILKYSFSFKEIRFATISEDNEFVYDTGDSSISGLADPVELSFASSVLDFSDIVRQFVKAAYDEDFITYDFLEMFIDKVQSDTSLTAIDYETAKTAVIKMFAKNDGSLDESKLPYGGPDAGYLIAFTFFGLVMGLFGKDSAATWKSLGLSTAVVAVGAITIGVALKITATMAAVGVATGPVGWIVTGVLVVAAGIGYLGYTLWKNFVGLNRYNMERFYKSLFGSKNNRNIVRFAKLISSLQTELAVFDNSIKAYTFSTDDDQISPLQIESVIYYFEFKKDSDAGGYRLTIRDTSETQIESNANGLISLNENLIPPSGGSIQGLNVISANTKEPYKVAFIQNASAVSAFKSNNGSDAEIKNHLTNYTMLITTMDLTQFESILNEVLRNVFIKD